MYAAKKSCTPLLIAFSTSGSSVGGFVEAMVVWPAMVGPGAAGPSAATVVGGAGTAFVALDATGADEPSEHAIATMVNAAIPRARRAAWIARRLTALFKQAGQRPARRLRARPHTLV